MTSASFDRGAAAAELAAKSSTGSTKFAKTHFFSLADGERDVLRMLNSTEGPDGWITVNQHQGVPTKSKPDDYKGNWPSNMPAICRSDRAFSKMYDSCYICDNLPQLIDKYGSEPKAKPRNWALAVRRVAVLGDGSGGKMGGPELVGKVVGYTDSLRDFEVRGEDGKSTGEVGQEIDIVIINQAYSTFFEPLNILSKDLDGDIRDYDFIIRRSGKTLDTSYNFLPVQPQSDLRPGHESWSRYDNALQSQNLDLENLLSSRASDEYYGRFFDPSIGSGTTATPKAAPAAQQFTAPSGDTDEDAVQAMRNRLRTYEPVKAGQPD